MTTILAICGSLRAASYNRGLVRAAQRVAPEGVSVELAEIGDIPLFSEDVERQGDPPAVAALKERIKRADGVLIATPEYNWGTPGVLKNALDWALRPVQTNVLKQKPVALMGASTGPWGTTRSQLQLRQTLAYGDALVLPQPNVFVQLARDKFDERGELTDENVARQVRALLEALVAWSERLRSRA